VLFTCCSRNMTTCRHASCCLREMSLTCESNGNPSDGSLKGRAAQAFPAIRGLKCPGIVPRFSGQPRQFWTGRKCPACHDRWALWQSLFCCHFSACVLSMMVLVFEAVFLVYYVPSPVKKHVTCKQIKLHSAMCQLFVKSWPV
jgi:hypothetical protein